VRLFQRLPRREVLVIAGAALVAFAVTLGIMGARVKARSERVQQYQRQETVRKQKPPVLTPAETALSVDDFLLPESPAPAGGTGYVPYRPRLVRWSPQAVSAYWISPRQIAIDIIASINDQAVQRLLEKVP
jgi:hypothetical protein